MMPLSAGRGACGPLLPWSGVSRIFRTSFASVYPHYVTRWREGAHQAELDQVIEWLTGFDGPALSGRVAEGTTIEDFFADALERARVVIKGVVCGVRVEDVEDPLMQKIRYLDKLVDELAKGRSMDRVLRS